MRIEIELAPSAITITPVGGDGPYPLLVGVGSLHQVARTGADDDAESPSLVVSINNDANRAASILGEPLRRRATVYDDDGTEFFDGTVATIAFGRTLDLTLEA